MINQALSSISSRYHRFQSFPPQIFTFKENFGIGLINECYRNIQKHIGTRAGKIPKKVFLHENFGTVKFWYCLCNCICYLPSALPSNKVRWPLTHVVLRDPWQIQTIIFLLPHCFWPPKLARWWLSWIYSILWSRENNYISTTTNPMATELGSIVTYFKGLLPFKLQDS